MNSALKTLLLHILCKHTSKQDLNEIKRMSFGNLNMLIVNGYLLLFALYSTLKAVQGTGVEEDREQLSIAVVHSCQNHVDKTAAQLWVQSLLKPNFFSVSGPFWSTFFIYCTACDGTYFGVLLWHLGHSDCLAQLALFASNQYWHVRWAWLHVSHQT